MEALLNSKATRLIISSEFARKQEFKLKKLERLINVRNIDGLLNKEELIENTVEVNIYYKGHRERTEIDSDFGNAMISVPQPRNRLENRRGENDKVPRRIQKVVEANTRKVRMAEAREEAERK